MKRTFARVVGLAAGIVALSVPAAAFEATVGNVNIIGVPPSSGSISISDPGLVVTGSLTPLLLPPSPAPTTPAFVLEGTVFNKRTGQPVEGAVVVSAFPSGHPPFGAPLTLSASPPSAGPISFAAFITSDPNGLYSTQGDATQNAGIMVHCAFGRGRDDRLATATATFPRSYVPYLRRDVYLELPRRVTRCDTALTVRLLADAAQP